ncbi:unnamed protein product [Ambrosiozyma monospora]|uniref:Unnamed protein product n=1 Tax=Ambrosiozyma monospora TaxID=43982 RepID=A0ACB5T6R5_AMBMO|nr:unnamed protein product [Ambrosiozyma monospora]
MKFQSITTLLLTAASLTQAAKIQAFPQSELDSLSYLRSYKKDDVIPLECIQRQIDNGEHVFDKDGNIVYTSFPKCLETNKPLYFLYGKDEEIKCTLKFEDEVYHMFQLYLHQDVPFTCRYALRPDSKLYLPLDINLRGTVEESHFDLDPNVNILLLNNKEDELVAATAFSSSLNTTKVIIGDTVQFKFNIKWLKADKEITDKGFLFYKVPVLNSQLKLAIYSIASLLFGIVLSTVLGYKRLNRLVKSRSVELGDFNKAE